MTKSSTKGFAVTGALADYRERQRREAAALRDAVLKAALAQAREIGFQRIKRNAVAVRAGVGAGTVNNAFGDMDGLRAAVMREAISGEHLDVLAQGLSLRDPIAMNAPSELKVRALQTLA